MIALDTTIPVRAIVREVQADGKTLKQQEEAQALLTSGEALFLPVTVMQELEWVLRGVYGLPRAEVHSVLSDLMHVEQVVIDRVTAIAEALEGYKKGLDFSDALQLAQSKHCQALARFDDRFRKGVAKLSLAPPVQRP